MSQRKSIHFRQRRKLAIVDSTQNTIEPTQLSPNAISSINDFCIEFLKNDHYNKLMKITKEMVKSFFVNLLILDVFN